MEERIESKNELKRALYRALTALTGERVASDNWRLDAVDHHLRPMFIVFEGRREVDRGEDLAALKTRLSAKIASRLTRSAGRVATTGQTDWSFGRLPVTRRLGGGVEGYRLAEGLRPVVASDHGSSAGAR